MNKAITDVITKCVIKNEKSYNGLQSSCTPYIDNDISLTQVTEFIFNCKRVLVNPKYGVAFRSNYIYLKSMDSRKYYNICNATFNSKDDNDPTFPIKYLISENVIYPFLLFINKKMVPWDMIRIVLTQEEYYILCNTRGNEYWTNEIRNIESVDVMRLFDNFVYIDFPIDISGKNKFDIDSELRIYEHDDFNEIVSNFIKVKQNDKIRISFKGDKYPSEYKRASSVCYYDKDRNFIKEFAFNDTIYKEYHIVDINNEYPEVEFITINWYDNEFFSYDEMKYLDICVTVNEEDTTYEPYHVAVHKVFNFDEEGYYTDYLWSKFCIINEDAKVDYSRLSFNGTGVNAIQLGNNNNIKYFPNNVILFKDNILDTESKVEFTSIFMTINSGKNPDKNRFDAIITRNTRVGEIVDNIKNIRTNFIQPYILNENDLGIYNENVQLIKEPFDFNYDESKSAKENLDNAVDYIMNYNPSLFKEVYLQNQNLFIKETTGKWVIDNVSEDGTLIIPRKHGKFTDEYILMLVNGILYEFYYTVTYDHRGCIIPIQGIYPDDIIEFLIFDDINNNSFDLTIKKDTPFENIDENYINENMILFSTIPSTDDFDFPEDGLQHFPVEYSIRREDNNLYIELNDDKYYDTPLKVVYKYQFKHHWFNINRDQAGENYCIDLGSKFMYCDDYSKFMVFFNGRRLSTDQYRLCLPVRSTTPFYRFELYLTMFVNEGDRVDILYTPSLLKDITLIAEIDESGKIVINKEELGYGLDNDLYMVWANGKKIPASQIADIDSTHIRIISDIQTHKYVSVTKILPNVDELVNAFKHSSSIWDNFISKYTDNQIKDMLEYKTETITDTEEDKYANSVDVKSIMLELIREKYIMNSIVDTTKPFVYDYQDVDDTVFGRYETIDGTESVGGYDSEDNALIAAADATVIENISNIERNWP